MLLCLTSMEAEVVEGLSEVRHVGLQTLLAQHLQDTRLCPLSANSAVSNSSSYACCATLSKANNF